RACCRTASSSGPPAAFTTATRAASAATTVRCWSSAALAVNRRIQPSRRISMNTIRFALIAALSLAVPVAAAPASIHIQHDEGTSSVPLTPKRVVVLDEESLGFMTALGIPVVGLGGGRLAATDVARDGTIKPEVQREGFLARTNLKGVQSVGSWV